MQIARCYGSKVADTENVARREWSEETSVVYGVCARPLVIHGDGFEL